MTYVKLVKINYNEMLQNNRPLGISVYVCVGGGGGGGVVHRTNHKIILSKINLGRLK